MCNPQSTCFGDLYLKWTLPPKTEMVGAPVPFPCRKIRVYLENYATNCPLPMQIRIDANSIQFTKASINCHIQLKWWNLMPGWPLYQSSNISLSFFFLLQWHSAGGSWSIYTRAVICNNYGRSDCSQCMAGVHGKCFFFSEECRPKCLQPYAVICFKMLFIREILGFYELYLRVGLGPNLLYMITVLWQLRFDVKEKCLHSTVILYAVFYLCNHSTLFKNENCA